MLVLFVYCNLSMYVQRVLQVCSVSNLRCCWFQIAVTSNKPPAFLKVKLESVKIQLYSAVLKKWQLTLEQFCLRCWRLSQRLKQANSVFTKQPLASAIVGIWFLLEDVSCLFLALVHLSAKVRGLRGSVYCLVQLHHELICVLYHHGPPACCYLCTDVPGKHQKNGCILDFNNINLWDCI